MANEINILVVEPSKAPLSGEGGGHARRLSADRGRTY
jgi:hypothetical protein